MEFFFLKFFWNFFEKRLGNLIFLDLSFRKKKKKKITRGHGEWRDLGEERGAGVDVTDAEERKSDRLARNDTNMN